MSNESRGTIALILGLLSFFGGSALAGIPSWILGVGAWILGNQVLASVSPGDPQYGYAKTGKILGIISLVIAAGWVVFVLLWVFGLFGLVALGAAAH